MKVILFLLCCTCLISYACKTGKKGQTTIVKQGIAGHVYQVSGNQMPMKNAPVAEPKGFQTTVYIYEKTNTSQVVRIGNSPYYSAINTKSITSVTTDSTGAFAVSLAAGTYSLFIKTEQGFYANLFDGNNNIFPVVVEEGKLSTVKFIYDTATH